MHIHTHVHTHVHTHTHTCTHKFSHTLCCFSLATRAATALLWHMSVGVEWVLTSWWWLVLELCETAAGSWTSWCRASDPEQWPLASPQWLQWISKYQLHNHLTLTLLVDSWDFWSILTYAWRVHMQGIIMHQLINTHFVQWGAILKVDYTLLVTVVATGHNEKEVLCVLLKLHGWRVSKEKYSWQVWSRLVWKGCFQH